MLISAYILIDRFSRGLRQEKRRPSTHDFGEYRLMACKGAKEGIKSLTATIFLSHPPSKIKRKGGDFK